MEGSTSVVQVTNIAPQATKDQMHTLFSFVGRVDEVRLYPSVRDASISIPSRCCFVKFADPGSVAITLHLNNTVFIDRAIIITPVAANALPEENEGLVMAMQVQQQQHLQGGGGSVSGNGVVANGGCKNSESQILSANPGLVSFTAGGQIATDDPSLEENGLPSFPLLSADVPVAKVEEIRRTVVVAGLDSTISAQQCMEFFADHAGEVKYFRFCTRESDSVKYALVEFTERSSVSAALNLNGATLGTTVINVVHATESISKPQNKSNEAVQKEIEEAMTKVKEANCLVSAAVDPLMGMLGAATTCGPSLGGLGMGITSSSTGRSTRSRSRGIRSHSRDRRSRRTRSRSRPRRSRSRDRRRYRSRSRSRDRSKRYRRSRSRDKRSKRSRSRENGREENGENIVNEEKRKRSRSRDRRRRSRSYERKRDRRRDRSRSRSRDRRRRSRSRSDRRRDRRRSRSRSRDRKRRSSSKEPKITRDYDQEEAGFESKTKLDTIQEEQNKTIHGGEAPMEISDSP